MGKRSSRAVAEKRRAVVRTLMARGLEQHEILTTFEQDMYANPQIMVEGELVDNPNFVGNPKTGEPVNKSTISRDWNHALENWQEEAVKDVSEHFARQKAELSELKRLAWGKKNVSEVRQIIALEMKLLGTAKPEKKEHRWDDKQLEQMKTAGDRVREKLGQMRSFSEVFSGDK